MEGVTIFDLVGSITNFFEDSRCHNGRYFTVTNEISSVRVTFLSNFFKIYPTKIQAYRYSTDQYPCYEVTDKWILCCIWILLRRFYPDETSDIEGYSKGIKNYTEDILPALISFEDSSDHIYMYLIAGAILGTDTIQHDRRVYTIVEDEDDLEVCDQDGYNIFDCLGDERRLYYYLRDIFEKAPPK